jgi:3-dehydroquinate dehydratase II
MSAPGSAATDLEVWAGDLGRSLRPFRPSNTQWRLSLIDGPNMSNLGEGGRDRRTYGSINSIGELQRTIAALADGLGVTLTAYQSNREGDIVAYIYNRFDEVDAFLINPAALTRRGAPCALALADSGKPYIELHFANIAVVGWLEGAMITQRAAGVVMGLRHYSYICATFGLICGLDARAFAPEL